MSEPAVSEEVAPEAPAALVTVTVPADALRGAVNALAGCAADMREPERYRVWYAESRDAINAALTVALAALAPAEDGPPAPAGRWLHRSEPEPAHRCVRPDRANRGDLWECECGRRWRCTISAGPCVNPVWSRWWLWR